MTAFSSSSQNLDSLREVVMLRALLHVPFEGWSPKVLQQGAADAGLKEVEADILFPGGVTQAVEVFSTWADQQMEKALNAETLAQMRTRDKVALGIRRRLEALVPYREAVRRTISFLALPTHNLLALRLGYETVNKVWYLAGDKATDYNFYTKRILLAGVLATTTLYWLDDLSEGNTETWSFLDRRIDDALQLGKTLSKILP